MKSSRSFHALERSAGFLVVFFGLLNTTSGAAQPPLPSWVPAPGTFANISLNTMADVDPCPARNCVYTDAEGQEAVFIVWNGGAYAREYSEYGALLVHGGGHAGYSGNEVYAFDLTTRLWNRIGYPSPHEETQIDANGEFPDGQPFPPHTFTGVAYLSPADGGGPKGSFLRFGFAGAPTTQWIHRLPLATGPNTAGAWSRFALLGGTSGLSGSYWSATYDASRKRFWVISGGTSYYDGFGYVTPDGTVTMLPNQGSNLFSYTAMVYCPQNDMLVHIGTNGSAPVLNGKLASNNEGFAALTMSGTFPPDVRNFEWSSAGGYFVVYPGNGSTTVYKLTPPASDPLNGVWAWSSESLTGADGAVPSVATGTFNGIWTRFREVPPLSTPGHPTFVFADGRSKPVQLWRLGRDTPAPPAAPINLTVR